MRSDGRYRKDVETIMTAFDVDELLDGLWLKIGDHGESFRLVFHKDGMFTERQLFDDTGVSWTGTWELLPSRNLVLTVMTDTTYLLVVPPGSQEGLHFGEETIPDDPESTSVRYCFVHAAR
jgi:hypothetical protein